MPGKKKASDKPSIGGLKTKKGLKPNAQPDYSSDNPYKLKVKAVEDLVTANKENSPPVSKSELRKYHAGQKKRWPSWLKAILLKVWFAGVICYFLIWGLSTVSFNQFDHMLILGIALGMCTNLLTNNILRFLANPSNENDRWMMFPSSKPWFIPLDILYALLLIYCVIMTYGMINTFHGGQTAAIGVEPILFGIFTMAWDMLFLFMKQVLKNILKDAKRKR
ncbi:MAG: hypothetical protein K6A68_16350 [Clostridiales bacterium]|nr:hypothetical protein [Clostridiales bacterium]